jgi:alcohol dehydrogenase class IV
VAINHAGTHLVHALSYPLGGTWHLPHGVANAIRYGTLNMPHQLMQAD